MTVLLGCGATPAPMNPDPVTPGPVAPNAADVAATLDALHAAAARADGPAYFGLFTPDAVFIGTDASERWTIPEFQAYAQPHFSQGRGWAYQATERHVAFAPDGAVAWFDEALTNEKYGAVRGSGVLVRTDAGWRVAHYVLSFPIPNEAAGDVIERVQREARPAE